MATLDLTPRMNHTVRLEAGMEATFWLDRYEDDDTTIINVSTHDYEANLYELKGTTVIWTLTVGDGLTLTSSDDGDNRIAVLLDTTKTDLAKGSYRFELIDITVPASPEIKGKIKIEVVI